MESNIESMIVNKNAEKTYIDKILAKKESSEIREILKKDKLSKSDIHQVLNTLVSTEVKLYNFNEYDRYIIGKIFVWVREFVTRLESTLEFLEKMEQKSNTCMTCNKTISRTEPHINKLMCECSKNPEDVEYNRLIKIINYQNRLLGVMDEENEHEYKEYKEKLVCTPILSINQRSRHIFNNIIHEQQRMLRFIVDIYLYIARSTLSLGATGFKELIVNKFEYDYKQSNSSLPIDTKNMRGRE